MASTRGINIDFDAVPFTDVLVDADALRLKQVFLNLLTNAIKYNRQGGRITIICDRNQRGALVSVLAILVQGLKRLNLITCFNHSIA
jgi:signal transduction histidine kinase